MLRPSHTNRKPFITSLGKRDQLVYHQYFTSSPVVSKSEIPSHVPYLVSVEKVKRNIRRVVRHPRDPPSVPENIRSVHRRTFCILLPECPPLLNHFLIYLRASVPLRFAPLLWLTLRKHLPNIHVIVIVPSASSCFCDNLAFTPNFHHPEADRIEEMGRSLESSRPILAPSVSH